MDKFLRHQELLPPLQTVEKKRKNEEVNLWKTPSSQDNPGTPPKKKALQI